MPPHVLLLGGHGKISQLLTPLLLSRSWAVTSVIRSAAQEPTIAQLGANQPGTLSILLHSLEDMRSPSDAQSILDATAPDYIVWAAGAGGKGAPSRTFAIDRDAFIHFAAAARRTPRITKFLTISYLGSRRRKPSWWPDAAWQHSASVNAGALKNYHEAKVAADEYLASVASLRADDGTGFAAVNLRPGALTDDEPGQEGGGEGVVLGKVDGRGKVARWKVAEVAARLLESGYAGGWLDLLDGDEEIGEAVERCAKEQVDCIEGEDVETIKAIAK